MAMICSYHFNIIFSHHSKNMNINIYNLCTLKSTFGSNGIGILSPFDGSSDYVSFPNPKNSYLF